MQENSSFLSENPVVTDQKPVQKERAVSFILSIILLVIVGAFSGTMHFLTMQKNTELEEVRSQVSNVDQKIKKLEKEKENKVASLLLDKSIPSVQLTPLLTQFRAIASRAQVQFQGFMIQDDKIGTNLIAVNDGEDAVKKILEMMQTFAKEGQQGTFSLEPVLSIRGDRATRTTTITFKIVPKTEINEDSEEKTSEKLPEKTEENSLLKTEQSAGGPLQSSALQNTENTQQ